MIVVGLNLNCLHLLPLFSLSCRINRSDEHMSVREEKGKGFGRGGGVKVSLVVSFSLVLGHLKFQTCHFSLVNSKTGPCPRPAGAPMVAATT